MKSRLELIESLQTKIDDALRPMLPTGPYALLDFPNHANVGDTAIWKGEIAYFLEACKAAPSYVCQISDYDPHVLAKRVGDGPIFIHGGGNFGDIWPAHQRFREQILRDFPDKQVIQLPQSIHFSDHAAARSTKEAIASHRNFSLLVRDRPSIDFAKTHFDCRVELCPDMAFSIGPIQRANSSMPYLAMLRGDKESASHYGEELLTEIEVDDWLEESKGQLQFAKALGAAKALALGGPASARLGKFNAAAEVRFERGRLQLSQAHALITDRLHVHIMAILLGIPHAVLDNSYGKITRFMDEFEPDLPSVYRAKSASDAMTWVKAEVGKLGIGGMMQ